MKDYWYEGIYLGRARTAKTLFDLLSRAEIRFHKQGYAWMTTWGPVILLQNCLSKEEAHYLSNVLRDDILEYLHGQI